MKKLLIALASAFVLCIPAFATDSYFSSGDYEVITSSGTSYKYSSIDNNFSYFLQPFNGTYKLFVISNIQNASGNLTITYSDSTSSSSTVSCSNSFASGQSWVAPVAYSFDTSYSFDPALTAVPAEWSNQDIEVAFLDYLSNLPFDDPSVGSSFTLPRGNVLYFQVETEQDVHFTSYMDSLSYIINFNSVTYGAWGDTGQRYGEAAALPTAGTMFPLLSQSPIAWQKDSSTNILGQTKVGLATKHCIVGQWYCFYNPNANHVDGADPYNASPGASVVIQGSFSQIKVYPVNQKLSVVDGDLYSGSNDNFDSYYDGSVDQDGTVTWTNQDGNIEAPAAGGQNFEDGPKSATSLLEGIRITLETVVHELQTLFTFGYSAIQSLVGIMSDFVSVFSGLYTWLPAEVYSALMSAVVVAIVIGVFKVFL